MPTIAQITNILKKIKPSADGQDIITSRIAQNIRITENLVELDLIAPAHMRSAIEGCATDIDRLIKQSSTAEEVKITLKILASTPSTQQPKPLKNIKHIIAVSSCKGGVGKSTIAANLAVELKHKGYKVGLLDADIFGPSVPTLFNIQDAKIKTINNVFSPIEKNGLKLMSFGFLLGAQAAVMRGPIVTRYIQQMLVGTDWGALDYLLIDMPPGTGDVHLTITQTIQLSGAIIVTTPHTLSLIDVARGILMFEKVSVPILSIIENMAYFSDPRSAQKHYIFGQSSIEKLRKRFGLNTIIEIPVSPELGQSIDAIKTTTYITAAADALIKSTDKAQSSKNDLPEISFNSEFITLEWINKETWTVNNRTLRLNSHDALSVDEMSGRKILKDEDIPHDIAPIKIITLGNYAIGVNWSDGHNAGIYPYSLIKNFADIA